MDRAIVRILLNVERRDVFHIEPCVARCRLQHDGEMAKAFEQVCFVEQIARDDTDVRHDHASLSSRAIRCASIRWKLRNWSTALEKTCAMSASPSSAPVDNRPT